MRLLASSVLILAWLAMACGGNGTDPDERKIASVVVSPANHTLEVGASIQMSAQALTQTGIPVLTMFTWSTSDPSVAACSTAGLVTGVSEGTVAIRATAEGFSGTASITVVDPSPPGAPSGITATPVSNTEVDVTWIDNADNEEAFRIERESVPGGSGSEGGGKAAGAGAVSPGPGPSLVFEEVGAVGPNVTSFRDTGLSSGSAYRYRVRACNAKGCSDPGGSQAEVTTFPALVILTTELPHGSVGEAYQVTLTATGGIGTPAWSVSTGSLPAGLTLSGAGALSGTPTASGSFTFTVTVAGGGQTVSSQFTLAIHGVLAITTVNLLPDGVAGSEYQTSLQASGGDGSYDWSVIAGALPGGLTLGGNGVISGVPPASGISTFTVRVTSGGQEVVGEFVLRIYDPVEITTGPLPDGRVGTEYNQTFTATGGTGLYTWSLEGGGLPDGILLDPATGVVSGTPTAVGTFNFTVGVSSGALQSSRGYTITVTPALIITTTALPNARVGVIYTQFLSASGGDGTFSWSVVAGSLPTGLSLHSGNGAITGTPNTAGVFPFTAKVTSGGHMATADLSIGVYPILTVTTPSVPAGLINQPYSFSLGAAGGDGAYTWTQTGGTLPQGLTLGADGTISGTPTWLGTFNFSVRVESGDGQSANKGYSITIS